MKVMLVLIVIDTLLEQRPHSVLFGMLMAGYLSGAETGVLYIRDEYPASHSSN